MELRVLGPLQVIADGIEVPLTGAKERTLLGALLAHRGEVVSTDRLIEILWADVLPGNPLNALQARVSAVRKLLGRRDLIANEFPGYRIRLDAVTVDVAVFERAVGEARRATERSVDHVVDLYDQALALWRGDPFVDFAYEDFARAEITRLDELRAVVREERVEAMLRAGRHTEIVGELEGLVALHPLRERLWGHLMVALYRSGRQADALRAYQQARTALVEELGVEPTRELRHLEDLILAHDPELAAPERPVPMQRHNLPARVKRLVGRSTDTASVVGLLGEHRMVTLVGPGGVGKTSLALNCGGDLLARFADGVWLVELAAIEEPDAIPMEVARHLGLGGGDVSTVDQVCDRLRDRALLLIIDNCEHLVDAVARLLVRILEAAPDVRVIATSREPLGVPGELLWPTRPLGIPEEDVDPEDLPGYPAVELFIERVRAGLPDFTLDAATAPSVAEICRRLDGLPLAIELAAARARSLSVTEVATRLDDRFRLLTGSGRTLLPRQRTLEATIAWSYDLLTDEERDLFHRLAVFHGGWTLAAAEAVGAQHGRVIDLLAGLVDRSLVTMERGDHGGRYGMLETIRLYAAARLAESDAASRAALAHARWYLGFVESAVFQGPEQAQWAERFTRDHENLRGAIAHALQHDDHETAVRLAGALGWWWFFGNREEGRGILDQLIETAQGVPEQPRVRALLSRALLDFFHPTPRSIGVAEEALDRATASGDEHAAATARIHLAARGFFGTDHPEAHEHLSEALQAFRRLGDSWGEGFAGLQLMDVLAHRGDLPAAIERGEDALTRFRKTGDPWALSATLAHLGRYGRLTGRFEWVAGIADEAMEVASARRLPHTVQFVLTDRGYLRLHGGDLREARVLFAEAMSVAASVGNLVGMATIHHALGEAALSSGQVDDAGSHFRLALTRFEDSGFDVGIARAASRLGLVAELSGGLDEAATLHRRALRVAGAVGALVEMGLAVEGLGRIAAAQGLMEQASRLLGAGADVRARSQVVALTTEATETSKAAAMIEAVLDSPSAAGSLIGRLEPGDLLALDR